MGVFLLMALAFAIGIPFSYLFVSQWLGSFAYKPKIFIEPFAGGAIVGLTVAFENLADKVILVELDEQVASVWHTIINLKDGASWLANQIVDLELTPESASALLNKRTRSRKELALKTIVQNRINHGGILADGVGLRNWHSFQLPVCVTMVR